MAIEGTSILIVIILAVGGISMMTALLACYVCIFRDLCCRSQPFKSAKNVTRRAKMKKSRKKKGIVTYIQTSSNLKKKLLLTSLISYLFCELGDCGDCVNHQKSGNADVVTLSDLTQPADISMPTESENL